MTPSQGNMSCLCFLHHVTVWCPLCTSCHFLFGLLAPPLISFSFVLLFSLMQVSWSEDKGTYYSEQEGWCKKTIQHQLREVLCSVKRFRIIQTGSFSFYICVYIYPPKSTRQHYAKETHWEWHLHWWCMSDNWEGVGSFKYWHCFKGYFILSKFLCFHCNVSIMSPYP